MIPRDSPPSAGRTLARLIGRFGALKAGFALALLLLLLRTAVELAHPLLLARALDTLAGLEGVGGPLPEAFVWLLAALVGLLVARLAVTYASGVAATAVGQQAENGLRRDLFGHLLALRFEYHDENRSGATLVRALRDLQKARHFFKEVAFGWIEILLLLLGGIGATFALDPWLGLVTLGVFGGGVAVTVLASVRVADLDRAVSESYDRVTGALQENVAGARVVRAFGREREEVERFGAHMEELSTRWQAHERYWTGVMPWVSHAYHLALPALLAVGAARVGSGALGLGDVAAALFFARLVQNRIRPLVRLMVLGQQAVASGARVFEVLDDPRTLRVAAGARTLPAVARGAAVRLVDVGFAYAGGPRVLAGVSLEIPAGGALGLIGPTGAGKSTLAHLLPRLYEAQAGRVEVDGVDVRALDPAALRAAVAVVFQEALLFSGTVAENLRYGRPDLGAPELWHLLEHAAAAEFVAALPDGLDTVVGERGVSLSGGQRQRLALARSLATRPRVLVLDDATASVDAVTERRIWRGIRAAAPDATLLVISQRIPSVRACDRIAVLDEGRVTAVGSHAELLAASALYRAIDEQQRLSGVLP